jgi:hypothetical protein
MGAAGMSTTPYKHIAIELGRYALNIEQAACHLEGRPNYLTDEDRFQFEAVMPTLEMAIDHLHDALEHWHPAWGTAGTSGPTERTSP